MLLVDRIPKRYNRTPAEVLEMDAYELSLCIVCVQHADAHSAQYVRRIQRQAKGSMIPMPVPTISISEV